MFSQENGVNRCFKIFQDVLESGWKEASRLFVDAGASPISQRKKKPQQCSVVIVGAGMAGLGAARELIAAGVNDILILEAQGKAGGRACTVIYEGRVLELGAQWIHGEDNPVHRLAHKYNLLSEVQSCEGSGPYLKLDGTEIHSSLVDHVDHKISLILEDCKKFVIQTEEHPQSVGHFMHKCFEEYLENCDEFTCEEKQLMWELFNWHLKFQEIDNSCVDLNTLSARDWGHYCFTGGKDCINFLNGYSSVINVLLEDLPENIFHFNCPVQKISWNNNAKFEHLLDGTSDSILSNYPVAVTCDDGDVVYTQHVIVTSSVGYLKAHHRSMFEPSLPGPLVSVLEAIGFGVVDKVFLFYDNPWWDENTPGFQIVHSLNNKEAEVQRDWWWLDFCTGFDVLSRNPAVLLAWVGGEGAIHMEQLSEEHVGIHCTNLLRKCTKNKDIPLPVSIRRSQWYHHPYVRGGYSHTTTLNDKLGCGRKDLAQAVFCSLENQLKHPAILFAGEAVHESHFSTTHGAFESGQSQARVIVDYVKKRSESSIRKVPQGQ